MGGKAALVIVMGFSILIGFVARNLSTVSTRAQSNMSTYAAATESHNLALAGANAGLARLYQDTSWRGTETQKLSEAFNGAFTYTIANAANGRPVLRSISWVRGPQETLQDTVVIHFGSNKVESFSLYAWMTNIEGNIYFITGDTIWGRIHSNDYIRCSGTPTFMGKVTTSKGFSPAPGKLGNKAIFKNGYETGVAKINFPTDLSKLIAASGAGGRAYAGSIDVTLKSGSAGDNDGYALVYQGGSLIDSITFNNGTFNGVLGASGRVNISGALDGRLSVYSSTSIYITDDITYQDRSLTSNDVLGLISEKNVYIADTAPNATDVVIDASIFTRSGSFTAENYSSGSPRGHAYVNGSIVQHQRGAVGTMSSGVLKTGYHKAYRYDDRLSAPSFRPPFYPGFEMESFPIASWWESVRIPKFQ